MVVLNLNQQKPTNDYFTTTTGLNVRHGASNKYPISFTLEAGEKVIILSKKRGWYKILHSDKIGYVHPKYLSKYDANKENLSFVSLQDKALIYFLIGILIVLTILLIFKYYKHIQNKKLLMLVTHPNRGTNSEKDLVLRLLKSGISEQHIFHDLYVLKSESTFSQIDLIVITDVGIIVFEVKDYGGWIYGTGNQSQWTQVLAYGKQKYSFQNPVIQNNNHILNLKRQLAQYGNLPYYSIIVFYGDCVLKNLNYIPYQTFIVKSARVFEVIETILKNNAIIEYSDQRELIKNLKNAVIIGENKDIQNQHIENVRDLLGKNRVFD